MKLQEYVNRVKCEKYETFGESAFESVYGDAATMTRAIISANEYYVKHLEPGMETFCNENHIATIISFLGDRGVGKSSAMLSYAYFLSQYNKEQIDENAPFFLSKQVEFCVLPKIDVTMLTYREGLFDVVLAKMWDMFLDKVNSSLKKEPNQEQVKREFENVKRSYNRWNTVQEERGVSQLAELHGLSQSLNLRDDFSKLVDSFSKYMGNDKGRATYLVFAVDDLDMVVESAYTRLEELRLLLTIPKVIVLVTADMSHLLLNIQDAWRRRLDNEFAQDYALKYLAKVLPRNMRIYMPDSNQIVDESLQLVFIEFIQKIFGIKENVTRFTKSKLIDVILRKKGGLILYYSNLAREGQRYSLRDSVNMLAELEYVISDTRESSMKIWMKKEIHTAMKRLQEKRLETFVEKVLEGDASSFDRRFSAFCKALDDDEIWINQDNVGYRGTIDNLVSLYNRKEEWADFIKILIWLYSVQVSEELQNYNWQTNYFIDRLLNQCFSDVSNPEKHVERCFASIAMQAFSQDEMYRELDRLFHTLLFFDMKTVLSNMRIDGISESSEMEDLNIFDEPEEVKTYYVVKWGERNPLKCKASFYWFFENVIWYDQRRELFIKWLSDIWQKDYFGKLEYRKKSLGTHNMSKTILKWREKNNISSVLDIVPIQNVGMMMDIYQRIDAQISDRGVITGMQGCLEKLFEIIQKVYKEMEKYYEVTSENARNYQVNYAEIFESFNEALDMKEISRVYLTLKSRTDYLFDFDFDIDD